MKNYITISLLFFSMLCQAQINLVEHFGNAAATGYSMVVDSANIHIVGPTYPYIDSNNFALTGYLATYDHFGNLQYFDLVGDTLRAYEAEKLLIDSYGNKYIIGDFRFDSAGVITNQGLFVQKRDVNNNILWTVEYQDSLSNVGYLVDDATLFDTNKLAIIGGFVKQPDSVSGFDVDVLFVVIDSIGNLLTKTNLGTPSIQEGSYCVTTFNDSVLVIGGRKLGNGFDKNWVLMLDYQGNVLDEYISASDHRIGVWDIVKTQDGGLACASAASNGNFSNYRVKSYVEKLDSNLNPVWDYTIDEIFRDLNNAYAIAENSSGNIYIAGSFQGYGIDPDSIGEYGFVQKLSANGDSLFYKNYLYYNAETWDEEHRFYDLQLYNDALFLVGDANDFNNPIPPGQSLWLVSTDSNGIVSNLDEVFTENQTIVVYPNPARERINFLIPTPKDAQTIQVYDLHGSLFYQNEIVESNHTLDILSWPKGMYIYRIQNEVGISIGKFLKE